MVFPWCFQWKAMQPDVHLHNFRRHKNIHQFIHLQFPQFYPNYIGKGEAFHGLLYIYMFYIHSRCSAFVGRGQFFGDDSSFKVPWPAVWPLWQLQWGPGWRFCWQEGWIVRLRTGFWLILEGRRPQGLLHSSQGHARTLPGNSDSLMVCHRDNKQCHNGPFFSIPHFMIGGIWGYHINGWVNASPTTPFPGPCTLGQNLLFMTSLLVKPVHVLRQRQKRNQERKFLFILDNACDKGTIP